MVRERVRTKSERIDHVMDLRKVDDEDVVVLVEGDEGWVLRDMVRSLDKRILCFELCAVLFC